MVRCLFLFGVGTALGGGCFSLPCPRHSPKESDSQNQEKTWSFRKNHVLLRAEEMIMLKHGVREMIGYKARSRGLDSGEVCRRPSRTCSQALDPAFGHLSQTLPQKGPLLVSLSNPSPQRESWTPCFCYVVPTLLISCQRELSTSQSSSFSC